MQDCFIYIVFNLAEETYGRFFLEWRSTYLNKQEKNLEKLGLQELKYVEKRERWLVVNRALWTWCCSVTAESAMHCVDILSYG